MFNQNRTTVWEQPEAALAQSKLFSEVSAQNINAMAESKLAFHAHNWAITKQTFQNEPTLTQFFNMLSSDDGAPHDHQAKQESTFVTAVEAKNYPIFGCLYHPEY